MNIRKSRTIGSRILVELLEEIHFELNAYEKGLEIDGVYISDVNKAEKIFEIAKEIYILERELAILETVNGGK